MPKLPTSGNPILTKQKPHFAQTTNAMSRSTRNPPTRRVPSERFQASAILLSRASWRDVRASFRVADVHDGAAHGREIRSQFIVLARKDEPTPHYAEKMNSHRITPDTGLRLVLWQCRGQPPQPQIVAAFPPSVDPGGTASVLDVVRLTVLCTVSSLSALPRSCSATDPGCRSVSKNPPAVAPPVISPQ